MPIPVTCDCGRTLKVKDEMAGKKGRCPDCNLVLDIPDVIEAEALDFVMAEVPEERKKPKPDLRRYRDDPDEDEDRPARRKPARDEDEEDDRRRPVRGRSAKDSYGGRRDEEDEDDRPRRRDIELPAPRPRRRVRRESGGGGFGVNGGAMLTGVLMMVGAVVWFVVGLAAGFIFFYPPILFILGIIAFFKGLTGQSD